MPALVVTLPLLRAVCPTTPSAVLGRHVASLQAGATEADAVVNALRLAAFLGQLAFESNWLRTLEEMASDEALRGYEIEPRRTRLGNLQPGDGRRYKGRGYLQLTGRANYARAAAALNLPLVEYPDQAALPTVGARVAAWYWGLHDLNTPADAGDLRTVTLRINGGYNGHAYREIAYKRALVYLGAASC